MRIEFEVGKRMKYVLTTDNNGYQIGIPYKTNKGLDAIRDSSYFSNINQSLQYIYELGLRKSDAITFIELAKDSERIANMIINWQSVILRKKDE